MTKGKPAFPILLLAVTPRTDRDRSRLLDAVHVLLPQDPTMSVELDEANGSLVVGAMGEQHLDIIVDRLKREFSVEAMVGRPRVNHVETITGTGDGEAKYARQADGRGEYAHVKLRLAPLDPALGVVFENAVAGGAIPKQFYPAIEEGVRRAARRGVLSGCPVVGVRALVHDGSYHDIDSVPAAFRAAAGIAFDDAARRATPVLLEPVMQVIAHVPDAHAVQVAADLVRRGGQVHTRRDAGGGLQAIGARVPMAGLFGFAADLRSRTPGRASCEMRLDSYQPVPDADSGGFPSASVWEPRPTAPSLRHGSVALPEPPDDRYT